jgi:hypothetical protein
MFGEVEKLAWLGSGFPLGSIAIMRWKSLRHVRHQVDFSERPGHVWRLFIHHLLRVKRLGC